MGFISGTIKYLVFIANFVFALAGLALIILGSYFEISYVSKLSADALPTNFTVFPIVAIVVGAIIFITAFFGCFGALKENTCMITTYSSILLVIIIAEIVIAVLAFTQINSTTSFKDDIKKVLNKLFENYEKQEHSAEVVDVVQDIFTCCGLTGPKYWSEHTMSIPSSCCKDEDTTCAAGSSSLYENGCVDEMFDFLKESSNVLGYLVLGIAAIELFGTIFGFYLAHSVRKHHRRYA